VLLLDTVGFVHKLPPGLREAFRATLEEVVDADVVLHVADASSPYCRAQQGAVADALGELLDVDEAGDDGAASAGVGDIPLRPPVVTAWNKWDLVAPDAVDALTSSEVLASVLDASLDASVCVSAATGFGLRALVSAIERAIGGSDEELECVFPAAALWGQSKWEVSSEVHADENYVEGHETTTSDVRMAAKLFSLLQQGGTISEVVQMPGSRAAPSGVLVRAVAPPRVANRLNTAGLLTPACRACLERKRSAENAVRSARERARSCDITLKERNRWLNDGLGVIREGDGQGEERERTSTGVSAPVGSWKAGRDRGETGRAAPAAGGHGATRSAAGMEDGPQERVAGGGGTPGFGSLAAPRPGGAAAGGKAALGPGGGSLAPPKWGGPSSKK
jgi:hypothetical protein